MTLTVGKGVFATPEEAVWIDQAEETKEYIKQCKRIIQKSEEDIKLSAREVHAKFINGAKENIKVRKLDIKIKKKFLVFCESHIKKDLNTSEDRKQHG